MARTRALRACAPSAALRPSFRVGVPFGLRPALSAASVLCALSLCLACALVPIAVRPVLAGPNTSGVLFVHTDDAVSYTDDGTDYIALSGRNCPDDPDCPYDSDCAASPDDMNPTSGRAAGEVAVFWIVAAFPSGSCPRLKGVDFAIDYDASVSGSPAGLVLLDWGAAGGFELPSAEWPAPGSSTSVVWETTQRTRLATVYWVAAQVYDTGEASDLPQSFGIRADSQAGVGYFGDDSVPPVLDAISGFGRLGFGGEAGENPSMPTATREMSWGRLKTSFQ